MTDMSQGFGGGAPNQEQQPPQGAIPDSAPQPQWGQSLGQDVGNVANAVTSPGVIGKVGDAVSDAAGQVGDYLGSRPGIQSIKELAPRIMQYISHQNGGVAPQQEFEQWADKVNPNYKEDMNGVVPKVISAAHNENPDEGIKMLNYAGTRYDLHRMAAAKAMNDAQPNDTLAAQEMNTAFNFLPNGDKVIVAPGQSGNFLAKVTSADGQHSEFDIDRNQMQAFAQTSKGLFDTNIENPNIFKSLAATGAKQQRAPDAGDMVKQNNITNAQDFPGNRKPSAGEGDFGQPGKTVAPQTGGGTIGQVAPGGGRVGGGNGQPFTTGANDIGGGGHPVSGNNSGGSNDRGPTYNDAGTHRGGQTSFGSDDRVEQQAIMDRNNRQTRANVAQYVAQATGQHVAMNQEDAAAAGRDVQSERNEGMQGRATARANAPGRQGSDTPEARQARAELNDRRLREKNYQDAYNQYLKPNTTNPATSKPYTPDEIQAELGKRGLHPPAAAQAQGGQQGPQQGGQQGPQPLPQSESKMVEGRTYITAHGPKTWRQGKLWNP